LDAEAGMIFSSFQKKSREGVLLLVYFLL
jgi:hypothetical protein